MGLSKLCGLLLVLTTDVHCQYGYPPPYDPYGAYPQQPANQPPANPPEQPEGQPPPPYPGAQPQYFPPEAAVTPPVYSRHPYNPHSRYGPAPPAPAIPDPPEVETPPASPQQAYSPYSSRQPIYAAPQSYYQQPPQEFQVQPPRGPYQAPHQPPPGTPPYTGSRAYGASGAVDAYGALQSAPVGSWAVPQQQPPYQTRYVAPRQTRQQSVDWYPNYNRAPAPAFRPRMAPQAPPTLHSRPAPPGYANAPVGEQPAGPPTAPRRQATPPPECGTRAGPGVCCNPPMTCPEVSLVEDETNNCTFQTANSLCCASGTCKPPPAPTNPFGASPRRRPAYQPTSRQARPQPLGRSL